MPPGDGGDHAVDHATRCDAGPTAGAVDGGGTIEVHDRIEAQHVEALEEPPKVGFPIIGAGSSQYLHDHGFGHRHGSVGGDELSQTPIDGAPGCPVVFDPGGRVGEDQSMPGGAVSVGTSPMALAPRMDSASVRVIGCPAR